MEESLSLFVATCLKNGKRFVGVTPRTLANLQLAWLRKGMRLNNFQEYLRDVGRHGIRAFRFELIRIIKSQYVDQMLKYYINFYKSYKPFGYNDIWEDRPLKREFTLEHREKLSLNHKGHPQKLHTRKYIRAKMLGYGKGVRHEDSRKIKMSLVRGGKYVSRYTRIRISEALKGRVMSDEEKEKRRLTYESKYDSIENKFNIENYKTVCHLRNQGMTYKEIRDYGGIPYVSVWRYIRRGRDEGLIVNEKALGVRKERLK